MRSIMKGSTHNLADVSDLLAALAALDAHPLGEARGLFDPRREVFVTRAPGRLDLMGGIADYSGSLVLQYPIREATLVALQRDPAPIVRVVSLPADGDSGQRDAYCEVPLADFASDGGLITYADARDYFRRDEARSWAAYVAGVFLALMRERGVVFNQGARLLISSRVPEGKGVSSSAALEVSVMQAVNAAFGLALSPRELALLCQKVENAVVGAPCGVMDQMTSACGEEHRLLALVCQPAELQDPIQLPEQIAVWGIDSGIRHSVAGADYGSVRAGAFMGYRIIAELAGLSARPVAGRALAQIDDPKWRGYLANLTPAEYEASFAARLPERISGGEFLSRYHGVTDEVSVIHPDREYAVRAPTAHPIYENHRVNAFARLLRQEASEAQLQSLGELMYESHASYSACGLGSEGTDELVRLVREAGPASGLYGAKITGGGSGGTVAVLGRRGADRSTLAVAERYAQRTGRQSVIFSGSSPGAARFGFAQLACLSPRSGWSIIG
jgi:L-arabinokinase